MVGCRSCRTSPAAQRSEGKQLCDGPYSNRIENGRFSLVAGVQLAYGERHAIHGDVRARASAISDHSPAHQSARLIPAA